MLAKDEEGIKAMMVRMERYLRGKRLRVNVDKIMRFGKGEERRE